MIDGFNSTIHESRTKYKINCTGPVLGDAALLLSRLTKTHLWLIRQPEVTKLVGKVPAPTHCALEQGSYPQLLQRNPVASRSDSGCTG